MGRPTFHPISRSVSRADYAQGQADAQAARDKFTYAAREAARQKELLSEGISSQAQYDQAVLTAQNARQAIQSSEQRNASVVANLSGDVSVATDRQPAVKRAQAMLDRVKLNLGYTVVRAAQDGIVTKVDQLQVGSYVTAAKPVFALAGKRIWVEANFKENQLNHMRVGLIFVPMTLMVFATLDVNLRNEGAAMYTLIRNSAAVHARLVEGIRPDNPMIGLSAPDFDFDSATALARINSEISRQAGSYRSGDTRSIQVGWRLFPSISTGKDRADDQLDLVI